jgi:hypothetical protein
VGPFRHSVATPVAALPPPMLVTEVRRDVAPRTVRRAVVPPVTRDDVRSDLEQVFRSDYQRVVGIAARVLGSRDQAEDVAQEVFLAFGRSSVPTDGAPGWLSVAATHTALNLLRSGRRRTSREEAAAASDTNRRPPWCCGTAACPTPRSRRPSNCPPEASARPCVAPSPPCARS